VFLFRGGSNRLLLPVFTGSIVLWSLAMGLSILPCWDLFARVFDESRRAKVTGQAQALGQFARLLSAGAAGWLISDRSPLPTPKNYAVAMLVFAIGGLISAAVILFMKEYIPPAESEPAAGHDRSFRTFWRGIVDILRTDRRFVSALKVVALSYTMAAAFPVVVSYAQKHRGFSAENDMAWMVATRPYLGIPFALFCGFLAHRIGAARVSGMLAALMAVGIPLTFVVWGRWQLVPLFMVLLGESMSTYAMLVVMDRAPPRLMHHYLAIYFTACMIPGLAPLALAPLSDHAPVLTLVIIMLTNVAIAVGFLLLERRRREPSPAVESTAVAAPVAAGS
jgi:Na+/melibiose symporter-like transporter